MSEQIPGVPEGYRLKGLYWGHELRGGEWCLNEHGTIFAYNTQWVEHQKYQNNLLPVLERIEPPKDPMQAESIPGVPAGYRLGKRLNWKTNGNGTEETTFELVPVEQKEYEAVITLDLTDELKQHLADTGGIWISSGDRDAFDVDRSSIKIREKRSSS